MLMELLEQRPRDAVQGLLCLTHIPKNDIIVNWIKR